MPTPASFYTPAYITVQNVNDNTRVTALKTATTDIITPLIVEAENMVDSYIAGIGTKLAEDQVRKFPTDIYATVPTDVKMACVLIVSDIFLKGNPSASSNSPVSAENWSSGGYSVSFATNAVMKEYTMPQEAIQLLKPYRKSTASLKY